MQSLDSDVNKPTKQIGGREEYELVDAHRVDG